MTAMSRFTGEVTVTQLAVKSKLWRLEHDLVFEVGYEGSGQEIVVPKGFITDGATIPQWLWGLLPCWGTYSRAAVIHDYLCWKLHGTPHPLAPTRDKADAIFREAMRVCGTGPVTRFIVYWGAHLGGRLPGRPTIVTRVNGEPT